MLSWRSENRGKSRPEDYIGTPPSDLYLPWLLTEVCDEAGVAPTLPSPPNVEAVERNGKQATFLLLLNHGEEPATVTLDGPGRDLLTGRRPAGDIVLDPLGVAILQTGPETPT